MISKREYYEIQKSINEYGNSVPIIMETSNDYVESKIDLCCNVCKTKTRIVVPTIPPIGVGGVLCNVCKSEDYLVYMNVFNN